MYPYLGNTLQNFTLENINMIFLKMFNRFKITFDKSYNEKKDLTEKLLYMHDYLRFACIINCYNVVKIILNQYLIKGVNINDISKYGETAIYLACHNNSYESALQLIEIPELEINNKTDNQTPFMVACNFYFLPIINLLLERNDLNVNGRYENKNDTPWQRLKSKWLQYNNNEPELNDILIKIKNHPSYDPNY